MDKICSLLFFFQFLPVLSLIKYERFAWFLMMWNCITGIFIVIPLLFVGVWRFYLFSKRFYDKVIIAFGPMILLFKRLHIRLFLECLWNLIKQRNFPHVTPTIERAQLFSHCFNGITFEGDKRVTIFPLNVFPSFLYLFSFSLGDELINVIE